MSITYEAIKKANDTIRTTPIQGKDYAEVNQRIKAFRMVYPDGTIKTEMLSNENGVCVFKAEIYDGEKLLGTGHAYEKENSTFINKTSFVENCVPLDAMILTEEGWKFYYQLHEGERVLSLNMETNKVEYCDLLAVNYYESRPTIELSTSRFKFRCTAEHKWIIRDATKKVLKRATKDLYISDKIISNVPQEVEPSILGRRLGWIMCDCDSAHTQGGMISTGYISQSKYVDDIKELFGEPTMTIHTNENWLVNYEWIIPAKETRAILGHFGMATYKDLPKMMLTAPIEDVAGCVRSMLLADGDKRNIFASTYPELIEAMIIGNLRLGRVVSPPKSRWMKNSTRPLHEVVIRKTDGAYVSELKKKVIPPADVWCPTTENGTWFMKQGEYITLTSNCETSSIGRALGMCGFGIDVSVASAEEVKNAMLNQNTEGEKKASARQVEILKKYYKGANLTKLLESNKIEKVEDILMSKASELISKLMKKEQKDG